MGLLSLRPILTDAPVNINDAAVEAQIAFMRYVSKLGDAH